MAAPAFFLSISALFKGLYIFMEVQSLLRSECPLRLIYTYPFFYFSKHYIHMLKICFFTLYIKKIIMIIIIIILFVLFRVFYVLLMLWFIADLCILCEGCVPVLPRMGQWRFNEFHIWLIAFFNAHLGFKFSLTCKLSSLFP